jgi:hypothetical protein
MAPRLLSVPALTLLLAGLLTPGLLLWRGLSPWLLAGLTLLAGVLTRVLAGLVRIRLLTGLTPWLLAGLSALLAGLVPAALARMPAALPRLLPGRVGPPGTLRRRRHVLSFARPSRNFANVRTAETRDRCRREST